ncbi:tetratricopeptide repeat protein [Hymenobacter jeollabukensis]|uniref:Uncharacterized protein n=1 Tax=Hymenobacter jeollabukensis TaxID=2025313 RepID=A0A5R8WRW2_9BACT|nr:hypothetical protein [Hymenobacter jeollabukensis]TLM93162.1 hypothetical protein FDY95_11070 [Hymenobacter jeollabukensis]
MPQMEDGRWEEAAQHLLAVRRPAEAEQVIRRHLLAQPRHAFAHTLLGLALLRQARLPAAREAVLTALGLEPQSNEAYYLLGLISQRQGYLPAALRAIGHALRLQPLSPKYLGTHAWFLNQQGQFAQAQQEAERGLALDAQHAECLVQRVEALHGLQAWAQLPEALEQLQRARSDHAITHRLLGREALRQEAFAAAQSHFREALRLEPGNEPARLGAAQALRLLSWHGRLSWRLQRYLTFISEGTQRGQLRAWGHFLLILIPLSLLCIPLLLFLGFEAAYWRLHPGIRRLRARPDSTGSYARQTLYRYGPLVSWLLLGLALLPGLVWSLLQLGVPESALGPGLTGGLVATVAGVTAAFRAAATDPLPDKSPLPWLLMAAAMLAASLTAAAWEALWRWGAPPLTLLLTGGLLFLRIRRARRAARTD